MRCSVYGKKKVRRWEKTGRVEEERTYQNTLAKDSFQAVPGGLTDDFDGDFQVLKKKKNENNDNKITKNDKNKNLKEFLPN